MLTAHSMGKCLAQMVVAGVITFGGATLALAQPIECETVLGPGGKFKLEADLVCPTLDINPGITVDSATLDLNGHTVDCVVGEDGGIGILLIGRGAKLQNGTVQNCERNVQVAGDGSAVTNVNTFGADDSIGIDSDNNKLTGNTVTSTDNGTGIIVGGNKNKLSNNTIIDSAFLGFEVRGNDNTLVGNTADGSVFDGFFVTGTGNTLKNNTALNNLDQGIIVLGTGNTIKNNTALNNGTDIRDDNGNCDFNTYKKNTFETSDPACIE
ncbi:MAG: right-handed parallel beta-helix repeat-containing protein [Candidatus Binatia bacterium]